MNLDIPSNWQIVPFKEIIADSAFGPRFSGDNYTENGDIATLRTTDLDDQGRISYETMPLATLEDDKFEKHFLKNGDLVITRSGTCGIAAVFEKYHKNVLPGAFLIRFRLKEKAHPYFYRYFFNYEYGREHILSVATGAVQQNLNITNLETLTVPLPPKETQEKIVSRISTYDELIENNSRRIEILEEMARRIYREWFVHYRYPGHVNDELVDSGTELGEIPEGWEVKKLKDFLKFKNGKSPETKEGEEYPVYGSNGIIGKCNESGWEDGIIIGRVGAYCGSVEYCEGKFWGSDNTILATTREEYDFPLFAYYKLEDLNLRRYAGGSAQPLMTQMVIKDIKSVIPNSGKLNQFSSQARDLWKMKRNLEKKNKKLKETRDLLLPKLISGKIDLEEVTV